MTYTMIVEQTKDYTQRMTYDPETQSFVGKGTCMFLSRGCTMPYGWVKESGTPPSPHWDVFLIDEGDYELGEEIPVKIIGVFIRNDGDHKLMAVLMDDAVNDFFTLDASIQQRMRKIYPRVDPGEGWFGREKALSILQQDPGDRSSG